MKYLLRFSRFLIIFSFLNLILSCSRSNADSSPTPHVDKQADERGYQHGIDLLKKSDGKYWLIWASSGNPPTGPDANGRWTQDIYYSLIDPSNPVITPVTIISKDEAQEPASSAINNNGKIMITNEDGFDIQNSVGQRYGVYTDNLEATTYSYPQMVYDGGHSGHVAACGNFFVVHWSDDWDDSVAGADGIGTGKDVLIDIFDHDGVRVRRVNLATETDQRDWWPLIAGSDTHVCMAWQRYNNDNATSSLMYAVYNPSTDSFIKPKTQILENMKYYTYDVQYYLSIDRFLIRGTYADNQSGFAYLINPSTGEIVDSKTSLAPIQRGCQPAASLTGTSIKVVYPTYPNGVEVLSVTASTVAVSQTVSGTTNWSYIGTDGFLKDANTALFFSLSKTGIKTVSFTID